MQLEDDPDALEEEPSFESVGVTTKGLCFRAGGLIPICAGLQDREIKVCLLNLVNSAARVLLISAFTFDDSDFVSALVRAKGRGVAIYLVLDRGQMLGHSSCKHQKDVILHLLEWDTPKVPVRVYVFKPE